MVGGHRIRPADALLLSSRISVVEVRSGLARRRREAYITSQDHADALDALREDGQILYRFVEVEPPIVDLAGELLDRHPLRANDALQLASALAIQQVFVAVELPGPILLSSDDRLLVAARAEGMQTDNPNAHA